MTNPVDPHNRFTDGRFANGEQVISLDLESAEAGVGSHRSDQPSVRGEYVEDRYHSFVDRGRQPQPAFIVHAHRQPSESAVKRWNLRLGNTDSFRDFHSGHARDKVRA